MKPKVYIAKKVPDEVIDYLAPICDLKMWESEESESIMQFEQA